MLIKFALWRDARIYAIHIRCFIWLKAGKQNNICINYGNHINYANSHLFLLDGRAYSMVKYKLSLVIIALCCASDHTPQGRHCALFSLIEILHVRISPKQIKIILLRMALLCVRNVTANGYVHINVPWFAYKGAFIRDHRTILQPKVPILYSIHRN